MARSQRRDGKLHDRSDARKARRLQKRRHERELAWPVAPEGPPPVDLTDRATSVTPRESLGNSQHAIPESWWPTIDSAWAARHGALARRWQARADRAAVEATAARRINDTWREELESRVVVELPTGAELPLVSYAAPAAPHVVDEVAPNKRARYARARARTIALARSALVGTCRLRVMRVMCACGPQLRHVGCRQVLLCDECRRPYYKRIRRRALAAVTARLADATTRWAREGRRRGKRPLLVLVTLTVPRQLDGAPLSLSDRQRRLVDGWRKLRQWLHRRIGAFPFVALPELTPGSDGTGHLHYHVLCVWPWWRWEDAQAEWRRATGLPDANPPDMRVVRDVRKAAHYVAKYACKGANVDDTRMTPELLADFVATYYGKRRVIPSVGWWVKMDPPLCPCCHGKLTVVERPTAAVDSAAAWVARCRAQGIESHAPPVFDDERTWRQVAAQW